MFPVNRRALLKTVAATAPLAFASPAEARVTVQGIVVYDRKPTLDLATLAPKTDGPSGHPNLRARMRSPEVLVEIDLRSGEAASVGWGCDLSYDYVKINADYRS